MLLTSLGNNIRTVTLGNHHERCTISLELINVWVHTVSGGWAHRTTRIALWSLSRSSIQHRILLKVLRHTLTSIQTSLELSVSDITSHNDGTLQVYTGRNRILRKLLAYGIDTLVQVDLDTLAALTWLAQLLRNQLCWVRVHLLQPDTVGIDLSLDITVSRTRYTHTDRTAGTMTRQTDYADIVSQVLTTKLGTQTNLLSLLNQLLLQVDITESTTSLITCCGQTIVELDRSQLHSEQVLLG